LAGPSVLGGGTALVRTPPARRHTRGGRRPHRLLDARKGLLGLSFVRLTLDQPLTALINRQNWPPRVVRTILGALELLAATIW